MEKGKEQVGGGGVEVVESHRIQAFKALDSQNSTKDSLCIREFSKMSVYILYVPEVQSHVSCMYKSIFRFFQKTRKLDLLTSNCDVVVTILH